MSSHPLRNLHLTSPEMHGGDVRRLQQALGVHEVDGQYGPITAEGVHHRKYVLGIAAKFFDTGATVHFQEILAGHANTSPADKLRAKLRARQAKARATAAHHGDEARAAAADFLLGHAGMTERAGLNRGDPLDHWQYECGHPRYSSLNEPGWPWCGVACHAGYLHGAGVDLDHRMIGTGWIYQAARANAWGFKQIPLNQAVKGDLLLLFAVGEHVGMLRESYAGSGPLHTIEGNTSFQDGSQSDGGALAKKERSPSDVVAAVRVTRV